jgi:REP element-mobilizing transposase RayT
MDTKKYPVAYFITFTTYGTWLHGNPRGSFMKSPDGAKHLDHDPLLHHIRKRQLKYPVFKLDLIMIRPVDEAIRIVCNERYWYLHELNVRTNHVHVVVTAKTSPGRVLGDFKRYATRRLRADQLVGDRPVWTEDGSKRSLWTQAALSAAISYVRKEQGPDLRTPLEG